MDLSRAVWHKSTRSGSSGDCVEVSASLIDAVVVRDSKDAHGPVLSFRPRAWAGFVDDVKRGHLDGR